MKVLLFLIALCFFVACKPGKKASLYKLDDVKKEMTVNEVKQITGNPTMVDDMGTATSENGDTTHIVVWHFGNNESVTFINGKVNDVDTDNAATQKRLEHIMDSAKNAQPQ